MGKIARPAQGNNSIRPLNRPRPAYKPPLAVKVVSSGSVSHPKDTKWSAATLRRQVADAAPKVIKL